MRHRLATSFAALLLVPALAAQGTITLDAVAETQQRIRLGNQTEIVAAGTQLIALGSLLPWGMDINEGNSSCSRSVTTGMFRDFAPTAAEQAGLVVMSSAALANGTHCGPIDAQVGANVVQLHFHAVASTAGHFFIDGTATTPRATIGIDANGDGTFEFSGFRIQTVVPATLPAGVSYVVRVRTSVDLQSAVETIARLRLRVSFRSGPAMTSYGAGCQGPGATEPFTTWAWAHSGRLWLEQANPAPTNVGPVLVFGTQRVNTPLPGPGCALLTDFNVLVPTTVLSMPWFYDIPYPVSARGGHFNVQWLAPWVTPAGTIDVYSSNAVEVILP